MKKDVVDEAQPSLPSIYLVSKNRLKAAKLLMKTIYVEKKQPPLNNHIIKHDEKSRNNIKTR